MSGPRPDPAAGPRAPTEAEARRLREAAALRDNLRRRKEQARARQPGPPPPAPPGGALPQDAPSQDAMLKDA